MKFEKHYARCTDLAAQHRRIFFFFGQATGKCKKKFNFLKTKRIVPRVIYSLRYCFLLTKDCMHNEVWGCVETLPRDHLKIPLNVPVLILREHSRRYIFWSRIMKRTDIEIGWTMFTLFHIKYCSSINTQIVKLRTSTWTCFRFLQLKLSVTILLFAKSKLNFK